ncbi:454_t:CDS:2, partial [Paraglomus brasilianum]
MPLASSSSSRILERLGNFLHPDRLQLLSHPIDENRLPLQIGSRVSVKQYNHFLKTQESCGYKFERQLNGDVYIIDMGKSVHGAIVSLLNWFFITVNGSAVFYDPL